ncbi:hypothetical protein RHMOL_Rhmol11G0214400 [Rhododendron molle]|uniref:Uncharacterized protein n=1 Tax=Rhododendron molle TaxID=49168 RepID=A0ACC0LUY8_RHOML|nr:hypothetical protein RHMOL_Rhmol11G0214400 [Rhododendron molle]
MFFFCILLPQTNSLTFNLTNFNDPDQKVNIILTPTSEAHISTQGLQITSTERSVDGGQGLHVGRATYIESLHLWDNSTQKLADFNTHFVFVIDSNGNSIFADGFTFFLAPDGWDSMVGGPAGAMGLPIDTPYSTTPTGRFVAVEFDTWGNPWDRIKTTHVGIDVNSIILDVTAVWHCNITHGIENEAWIRYDSSSHNLSVVFTGSIGNTRVDDTIHYIVDLREQLPERVTIGFSAATANGNFETHTVKSWEFSSSFAINESNNTVTVKPGSNKISHGAVVGSVVGSGVFVGGLVLVGFGLWKRSRAKEEDEFEIEMSLENEFEAGAGPKKFSYSQLSLATNNFEEGQKLGEGGFGGVYRGFLRESKTYIAVKRISKGSKQGIKEYATEVKIISRLDFHLFQGKSLLTWGTRYKIAQGLASALLYLHEEWEQCVVHRDVKSSNVMLDSKFNAKLGDFGLARFVDHEKQPETTLLAGTMGYLAPECMVTGKASKESDVYSFGIVALEIACGRKPLDSKVPESQMILVEWVWDLYGMGRLLEAVDAKLGLDFDEQEIERLMIVGLWCAHPDHNFRPKIRDAIHALISFEAPLPILPPKLLVLSFSRLPLHTNQNQFSSNVDSSKFISSSTASSSSIKVFNKE